MLAFRADAATLRTLTHMLVRIVPALSSTRTHDVYREPVLRAGHAILVDHGLDLPRAHGGVDLRRRYGTRRNNERI